MSTPANILISAIGHEVFGTPFAIDGRPDEACLKSAVRLARAQDLAHLAAPDLLPLASGLSDPSVADALRTAHTQALYRYAHFCGATEAIRAVFNRRGIPFILLKGAVLRSYYPEAWMRTSCDIDVLVHPEDLEAASQALTGDAGYSREYSTSHDVTFISDENVHVELHHMVLEDGRANRSAEVLAEMWEHTHPVSGSEAALDDDMFYFYHVAHMAKHFESGGCGVRYVLDLHLLARRSAGNRAGIDTLLGRAGLSDFDRVMRELAAVWFDGSAGTEVTNRASSFVLSGSAHGSIENHVSIERGAKRGGKLGLVLRSVFLPYSRLSIKYPILKKHKWLTPVCTVVRWFDVLFHRRKRAMSVLARNASVGSEEIGNADRLLQDVGLR